jgi:hypothetical protein
VVSNNPTYLLLFHNLQVVEIFPPKAASETPTPRRKSSAPSESPSQQQQQKPETKGFTSSILIFFSLRLETEIECWWLIS